MKRKIFFLTIISFIFIFSISLLIYAQDAQIEGENLNVRSGPGTDYDVISKVNPPEQYPVLEESGEWSKIDLGDYQGWIHKDYFSVIENTETENDDKVTTSESEDEDENSNNVERDDNNNAPLTRAAEDNKSMDNILAGKKIVLDPGHGGRDVGAIGTSGGFESNYTLKTAQVLLELLEEHGADVYLTRKNNQYVPLTSRTTHANLLQADVYLSIHYNSTPELTEVRGIDTYYLSERDKQLAEYVHGGIINETEMNDRGIEQRDLHVLRVNHRPSLLLELGFISNESEERNIQSRAYLEAMSRGIVTGLEQFFR
ncbi:SH3 domain-containing protein [Gracilibacillus salitolerans]|uniref:SH3 domain-containing protein n=1 Tax=Gracilibacillus salitolerans TaxID=2663022 RepID=A0A5Q2TLW5_9BACI|nr:N-acetylmuramoyl-L-alanine amidase [Gracilibacillus salitolerans]QGH35072.1 SH3 domain-containing protein [Gracilibacillus salitolerans]